MKKRAPFTGRALAKKTGNLLPVFSGIFLDFLHIILGDKAWAGADVAIAIDRVETVVGKMFLEFGIGLEQLGRFLDIIDLLLLHDRKDSHWDITLKIGLLINREFDCSVLDSFDDVRGKIKRSKVGLAGQPQLFQDLNRWISGVRSESKHRLSIRMGSQITRN